MRILFVSLFTLLSALSLAQPKVRINPTVKFLALGDSYTIGQSVSAWERWPVQLVRELRLRGLECAEPEIIATTGWRTDNLLQAATNKNLASDYTLVSLLIGVNNFYQGGNVATYREQFTELINFAVARAGGNRSKVIVVSIPDYGFTPFGKSDQERISAGIDLFNAEAMDICEKNKIAYTNITDISRLGLSDPELVAADGLHPSGKQYGLWAARIIAQADVSLERDTTSTPPGDPEDPVTSIEQESALFAVYPNPFQDRIVIQKKANSPVKSMLRITDITGKVVLEQDVPANTNSIELATEKLPGGFYTYQIISTGGSGKATGKILKAK